jgi:hypothetical protein
MPENASLDTLLHLEAEYWHRVANDLSDFTSANCWIAERCGLPEALVEHRLAEYWDGYPEDPDHSNPAYWEHNAVIADELGYRKEADQCRAYASRLRAV